MKTPDIATFLENIDAERMTTMWGLTPVAPLHLGYDGFVVAQQQMIAAGGRHTILLADNHAMMSHGLTREEVSRRSIYYETYFRHCSKLEARFVKGSEFQSAPDYVEALYKVMSRMRLSKIKTTLSKVTKRDGVDGAFASVFLYAIMQCLDCCYLDVDGVIAGPAQKKRYRLLDDFPELMTRHRRIATPGSFFYYPLGVDIRGEPLNRSKLSTRISIHDNRETLERKVRKMYAPPSGQSLVEGRANALLEHFRHSVFPWTETGVEISSRDDGSCMQFASFGAFEECYQQGGITPQDCKTYLFEFLATRLDNTRAAMGDAVCDWVAVEKLNDRKHE